ncbi:molecular chaperone DnaJ [Oscillatoriales cyanobacterium USR001]|nr:molecular chaperone DnaJ [Oscillatoriales cyanobacterium USR001]
MQNFRNYYQILGLSRDASIDEIKKAYRRLARQFHPDVNPGDKDAEDKFKAINEAYDILSDVDKRSQYDQFTRFWKPKGIKGKTGLRVPGFKGWGDGKNNGDSAEGKADFADYSDFNKFVDQLLGRRREMRTAPLNTPRVTSSDPWVSSTSKVTYTPGSREVRKDIEARLTLPLEKAYTGGTERIRLEDGRSLEVDMPGGMVSGQRIRLRNLGVGGGDLYLKITVSPHPFFKLERSDVCCQLPLTPAEAVLGGEIEVPTLDGWVKMKLPGGVFSGQRLRLAGKGYPTGKGDRGDQLVEIAIAIPQDISPQERELYEKLRQVETFKPRQDLSV